MTLNERAAKLTGLATRLYLRDAALLAGRLLLSLIFLHEGATLATHFEGAAKAMAALGVGLPLFIATVALQLGAGLSVATGMLARLGGIGLGLFCLATAMLFHTNFASQNELLHFEKDLAIAGGMFVLAAAGAGRFSVDWLLAGYLRQRQRDKEMVAALLAVENQFSMEVRLPV
ncbi:MULTISPECIES: DoxX family protein [unclassified Mesorhizobium]|uniref:DoxX family protein n=1 Tax=unclassified Mesorhizobium TaxID=325217 RepID=UPI000FDC5518|nr:MULTISPECIES: DoxX family protein [unclassified Mesorhizobium]TGR47228.1 DoxX family protein [bacterium M00.F.Ca.ET.199.01.1.1]TGU36678.1 DoxX family protein [bacterium M00.F.Ca.ET.156.01.1.1]TGV87866.1 DoxX family protein [Mesorhizobium sp. M00.F.Ca.ET.149.01.1.1]TGR28940.1 DoxX family protein [Mesorhizobium sp. M8A.F.Ca.ET.202.01.1.1]TGR29834.1 DoxX family protein [Mesorhizobium sp. M8A.F.Ca.ET.197.01.1.1]